MGEFEDLSLRPPVLNHSARCEQPRDGFAGIDDEPDCPPRYRSMDLGDFEATVYRSAARDESYRSDDDDDTKSPSTARYRPDGTPRRIWWFATRGTRS